jgi:large subunit ribosomal protein L18
MYNHLQKRNDCRIKRKLRVRKILRGTSDKPRLSVVKSNLHIYAQLIDDSAGITLVSYSSLHKGFDSGVKGKSKESARIIGTKVAEMAKEKNISSMIMDRGRCKYHGLIAVLATAVRESGILI